MNQPVNAPTLPSARDLDYQGLASTYARSMIIEWTAIWALMIAVNVGINVFTPLKTWRPELWWVVAIAGFLFVCGLFWLPMVARSRCYSLRDEDIHYRSGIIWHKTISLPFNRIQHVELESGPLQRIFKLSTLKFFTAGGGSADMKIPALTFAAASRLRSFVINKAAAEGAGPDDAEFGKIRAHETTGDLHDID